MEKETNDTSLDVTSSSGALCRQYIRGSCRFGPSCLFSHELPLFPSAEICRYFQKGVCWFGDRCRYQHVTLPDGRGSGSRWGSVPPAYPSAAGQRLPLHRRGSEPALSQALGAPSLYRRGSEPLVSGMMGLQHGFERLSVGIAEEEEQIAAEAPLRPCQQHGSWLQQHQGPNGLWTAESLRAPSTAGAVQARAGPIISGMAESPKSGAQQPFLRNQTSGLQGAVQSDSASPSSKDWPDEAYRRSKDVMCGICMDKVYEKSSAQERRFGILPNCSHAFCLSCIVTWRKTKDFQDEVIKACPQCRVKSSYYIPSKYWVSDGELKQMLISAFKEKSSKIRCSFFMRHGCCPFKSECIYRHEHPAGRRRRRRRSTPEPSLSALVDLDDSLQFLHYIIALAMLDSDMLDEELWMYVDDDEDPL